MTKKIVGVREASFVGRDGSTVEGYMISMTSPVPEGTGKGVDAESHYVTKAKLQLWGIDPLACVGQQADIFIARYNGRANVVGIALKH